MLNQKYKNSHGFTLIELLVVVAIIGLLSSVILSSLNTARAKARDARRVSDMKQMQTALELYFDDHGYYPGTGNFVSDCNDYGGTSWGDLFRTTLTPYLPNVPEDPLFPNDHWPLCYYYKLGDYTNQCTGTGHSYTMLFATEASSFGLKPYNIQGEAGTASRYCIHPD